MHVCFFLAMDDLTITFSGNTYIALVVYVLIDAQ